MPHIFAPLDLVPVKDKILVKTAYHIFRFVCRVPSVFLRNSLTFPVFPTFFLGLKNVHLLL